MGPGPIPPFAVVAGLDEAGLGPILGPLTIGLCAFRVAPGETCLWRRLADAVSADPARDRERLVVADSKRVFTRTPRGHQRLERVALAFLTQTSGAPADGRALLQDFERRLDAPCLAQAEPWGGHLADRLPLWCESGRLELQRARLARTLAAAGVEPLDILVRCVGTDELNRALERTGNKSDAHWGWVSACIRGAWDRHAAEGLELACDRQGGRMRYGRLLAALFPEAEVRVLAEGRERSEYGVREPRGARRMHLTFSEGAEARWMPVALASCLAKYTREVCMRAFNAYFGALQPGLAPTAGYTTDGRRWLRDAGPALARAGLAPEGLVRAR